MAAWLKHLTQFLSCWVSCLRSVDDELDYANSPFELVKRDDPDMAPLIMTISRQEAADKSLRKVSIPITHAEAAVLETVLETAVSRLIGW